MAEFDLWSKESLVMFAQDSVRKMEEYQQEIKELQQHLVWLAEDQKTALQAYRNLLRATHGPSRINGTEH